MNEIGVGIVGTGFAARAHLDALRRMPEVRVVAIAGRDAARAEALADRYGVAAHGGHVELLHDPKVDSVHVCTVNSLHHEISLGALEAGKHVLSEKPLALGGDASAQLHEAATQARAAGVLSGVCFNYRHYPLVQQIRELVQGGEYGAPHLVHGRYLQDWLLLASDWNWRLEEAEAYGGSRAVADIGSHWTDLVQHVTGEAITDVLADLGTLHTTRLRPNGGSDAAAEPASVESEDFGTVLVRFESGARGAFTISQASAGRKNALGIGIDCAEAAFSWDQEQPEHGWVGRRGEPNLELVRDPAVAASRRTGGYLPAGHPEGWLDALHGLFADFYGAVAAERNGDSYEPAVATFADGDAQVRLVEAVMASNRDQRWTSVEAPRQVTA